MTGWPLSRFEHLLAAFGRFKRCELCNSRQHTSINCWLHRHNIYRGLITGRLEELPRLKRVNYEHSGPCSEPATGRDGRKLWAIRAWADSEARRMAS